MGCSPAGAATVAHHELTTPRRFDRPWEADASLALRTGDPRAVDAYETHGRLLAAHPALIARGIADAHQRHVERGRTVAITTNTAETARAINAEIQRRLDPTGRRPRRALADGTHLAVGDQVATRRNDTNLRTDQGEKVRNRHTWTVTDLTPHGDVTVANPDRGTVALSAAYVTRHVELGWAVTGYGNQGDTVDIGLAVLEPGTTRNHAYVALTRGRTTNQAWIPDPSGTLDPADTLAGMIIRTPDHGSALATHARLHHDAGLRPPALDLHGTDPGLSPAGFETADLGQAPSNAGDGPTDERVRAMQARLDRLEGPGQGRSIGR